MGKTLLAIVIGIFFTGFIAGVFTGASIKTGEDINPDSWLVKTLSIFCDSVKDVEVAHNTCVSSFIIFTIMVFIVGIIEIFATASKIGNIRTGLVIYGIGWLIGILLIVLN